MTSLNDLFNDLKNLPDRLQDCDVEIDNDDLTVSEFNYDSRYGVTVSIDSLVEIYQINGERAKNILIMPEDKFDEIIDLMEAKLKDDLDMERIKHTVDDITRATTNLRVLLGVTNADHSER
jgi:hypothetical protein